MEFIWYVLRVCPAPTNPATHACLHPPCLHRHWQHMYAPPQPAGKKEISFSLKDNVIRDTKEGSRSSGTRATPTLQKSRSLTLPQASGLSGSTAGASGEGGIGAIAGALASAGSLRTSGSLRPAPPAAAGNPRRSRDGV